MENDDLDLNVAVLYGRFLSYRGGLYNRFDCISLLNVTNIGPSFVIITRFCSPPKSLISHKYLIFLT